MWHGKLTVFLADSNMICAFNWNFC